MTFYSVKFSPAAPASRTESIKATVAATPVYLPKEHGSWFLALEPLALGLLVAPSWAGGAFAGAVMAGFLARRPLKAIQARSGEKGSTSARIALLVFVLLAVLGLVEAVVLAGWNPLWPLLLALPLGAIFLHFDGRNLARLPAAELAGCSAFSLTPAILVLQSGGGAGDAILLTGVALARGIPAVLTVRDYLRLAKRQSVSAVAAVLVAAVAAGFLFSLSEAAMLPRSTGVLGLVLLLRTGWLLGPWRPVWTARRIGQFEAVLGVLYVGFSACWM